MSAIFRNQRLNFAIARTHFVAVVAFSIILSGSEPIRAQDQNRQGITLSPMAEKIVSILEINNKNEVALGTFRSPRQTNTSAGPVIVNVLTEELARRGIAVKRIADFGVHGEYSLGQDEQTGGPAVELKGYIIDRKGKEVYSHTWLLDNESAFISLFGVTAEAPLDQGWEARKEAICERIEQPQVVIRGNQVAASPDSPYSIEVHVADGRRWKPLTPSNEDGYAFASIKRGQSYMVVLHNDSPEDAAVTLTIDGLNMFSFSANKDYKHVIVPKKSRGYIVGWHKTNEDSDSFLVAEYAKSAAAELKANASSIGMITASFAAAWPKTQSPPPEERLLLADNRGAANATARGPEVRSVYRALPERRIGAIRAAVSIRYQRPQ